jgi:hypothetical protein
VGAFGQRFSASVSYPVTAVLEGHPPIDEARVGYGLVVHWGFAAIVVASLLAACLFIALQWFRMV